MIKRQESEASRKLFVAGLDVATMEGDLGEYFKKYGKVLDHSIKHKYLKDLGKFENLLKCSNDLGKIFQKTFLSRTSSNFAKL